jgi:hypothetical protein
VAEDLAKARELLERACDGGELLGLCGRRSGLPSLDDAPRSRGGRLNRSFAGVRCLESGIASMWRTASGLFVTGSNAAHLFGRTLAPHEESGRVHVPVRWASLLHEQIVVATENSEDSRAPLECEGRANAPIAINLSDPSLEPQEPWFALSPCACVQSDTPSQGCRPSHLGQATYETEIVATASRARRQP